MTEIIWSGPAQRDLFSIADCYQEHSPEHAETILTRIGNALEPLLTNPRLGQPIRDGSIRRWLVPKTPFILLYAVNEPRLEIWRVVHSTTDWRNDLR